MTYIIDQKLDCQLSTMVNKKMYDTVGKIAQESMLNRSDVVRLALIQYINDRDRITDEPVAILKEKEEDNNNE